VGRRSDEQIKLTATFLNTLAAGTITVGVIGPLSAAIIAFPAAPFDLGNLVVGTSVWLLAGLGLHFAARFMLREVSDDEG
jgi:hypothetical protein